jgi:hypothetical protein
MQKLLTATNLICIREKVKAFKFQTIVEKGNEVFVIYKCSSIDQDFLINSEYFTIEKGKIKSVNVFFGDK